MARKRLNKKVVIIGTIALAFMLLGAIGILLRLTQDPEEFIREGDAARAEKKYEEAARNYAKAFGLTKSKEKQIEIAHKLADLHVEFNEWPKAAGTWDRIITMDPKNVKARQSLLNYLYEFADSGISPAWRQVETHASELIEIEPAVRWYFMRGRARYEIANLGQAPNPDVVLEQSRQDLQKVLELQADHVDAYYYLAQCMETEGRILASRGALEEEEKSLQRSLEVLEKAVTAAPDNPRAHVNLLSQKILTAKDKEQIKALQPEFLALTQRFNTSGEAFACLSTFYLNQDRGQLTDAIVAIEKARELESTKADYALLSAKLYYHRGSYPWNTADITRAVQIAREALTLPATLDVPGPRQTESRRYRLELNIFLAGCYTQLALQAESEQAQQQKEQWLSQAEQAVAQVHQLLESGEHPYSVAWDGMLALARGDKDTALQKLYFAYERLKALKDSDREQRRRRERGDVHFARLCYALAKVTEDGPEIGARAEFLSNAIRDGILYSQPEVILDYTEVLLRLSPTDALRAVGSFEENFGSNERSGALRLRALIAAGQFEQAEQVLAAREQESPESLYLQLSLVQAKIQQSTVAQRQIEELQGVLPTAEEKADAQKRYELLRAELDEYKATRAQLLERLLEAKPERAYLPVVVASYNNYLDGGDIKQAGGLLDKYLKAFPDDTTAQSFKQRLLESDPANISEARLKQIDEQVLQSIPDALRRAVQLALFYQRNEEPDKAVEQATKALEIEPSNTGAVGVVFDVALQKSDFALAQKMVDTTVQGNLDGCNGQSFAARLAITRGQFNEALIKLDDALKQRPIFSYLYVLRSIANSGLGNEAAAIEDARKAILFNPLNGRHARQLASLLYQRDSRLGRNASREQREETKVAILRAMALNPADTQLLSFYAAYIADEEPQKALAHRQWLHKNSPSVENAVLLGNLAAELALKEPDEKRRAGLLEIASSALVQACRMDPQNKVAISALADFYRRTGEAAKAEELLAGSGNEEMTWKYYARAGQFDRAREILEKLYQGAPKNVEVVKGLLAVAERTNNAQAIAKYSAELLALEDTRENRLYQIQLLIECGLTDQADKNLQGFKERYAAADTTTMLLEAHLRTRQGQFDQALELLNRAMEGSEASAAAWRLRGQLNYFKGNYTQAISDLQKSKSIGASVGVRVLLAKAYLRAGRADDAVMELVTAVNDDQSPAEARILLEQIYSRLGRADALVQLYNQTLAKYPGDVFWLNRAANFLFKVGQVNDAAQMWQRAWEASQKAGGDGGVLDAYLMVLQAQKKYNELLEFASRHIDGNFASIAYSRMAAAKAATGDAVTAIGYFQRAIEKAGADNELILEVLRRMYVTVGQQETARWCTEQLSSKPDSLVANLAMFNIMLANAEYNNALRYIDKCLEIVSKESPGSETADVLLVRKANVLELGYVKTSDEQYRTQAIAVYETVLQKNANKVDALNNLAYMLAAKGENLGRAVQLIEHACELQPNVADFMDTYAFVLYNQGNYSKAAEVARSAIQLYEQGRAQTVPAATYDTLGKIAEKLKRDEEALSAYQQTLQAGSGQLSETDTQRITAAIERLSKGTAPQ
jgi:tetratricopeptide (TPR) repeat protein